MGSNKNNRIRPTTIDFVVSWEGAEGVGGMGPCVLRTDRPQRSILKFDKVNLGYGCFILDLCRKSVFICIG